MARRNIATVDGGAYHAKANRGFTDKDTGKVSNGGKIMSHRQKYYQVRVGLGLSGG